VLSTHRERSTHGAEGLRRDIQRTFDRDRWAAAPGHQPSLTTGRFPQSRLVHLAQSRPGGERQNTHLPHGGTRDAPPRRRQSAIRAGVSMDPWRHGLSLEVTEPVAHHPAKGVGRDSCESDSPRRCARWRRSSIRMTRARTARGMLVAADLRRCGSGDRLRRPGVPRMRGRSGRA
jgi:hypothetical protein